MQLGKRPGKMQHGRNKEAGQNAVRQDIMTKKMKHLRNEAAKYKSSYGRNRTDSMAENASQHSRNATEQNL
jgi:hypothetical protein